MKLFNVVLLSAILSSSALFALDFMPDKITDSVPEIPRMTAAELRAEKKNFVDFITKFRSSEFIGHTQYVLSALNLSIRANAKYSIETDGTIMFQLATDGNKNIHVSDVTFPMQGLVYFELRNADGFPVDFKKEEGETIQLLGAKNTFYIVETERSFQLRRKVQAKYNKEGQAIGRFLAITKYDLFTQDVEFYEIQNDGVVLIRRGSFNGNVPPSRRGW